MGQYIPAHIVEKIGKGNKTISLDGEAKVLTVLFCDIQDFTKIAEELNPKQVVSLLNKYFTALSKIIFSHNGTIDKFIGDSIMAFWGAPYEQSDHARKAVLAAIEMDTAVTKLSEQFIKQGWPGPRAGFGINTGLMAVGNMGSIYRMSYTVIGDAVNTAARIEPLCRKYRVPVIVSEATMLECKDILFRELDRVALKGKRKRVRIYQPLCFKKDADNALLKNIELHNEALSCYYKRQWAQAKAIFNNLSAQSADDAYYPVMLARIQNNDEALQDSTDVPEVTDTSDIENTRE
jgi:adenylate cyclase